MQLTRLFNDYRFDSYTATRLRLASSGLHEALIQAALKNSDFALRFLRDIRVLNDNFKR